MNLCMVIHIQNNKISVIIEIRTKQQNLQNVKGSINYMEDSRVPK